LEVAAVSIDGRLDKLTPALTAKERAILILRACKEGVPEDPLIRSQMPPGQALEFNRYIGLMNGVNIFLTFYTGVLDQALALLDARHGWLLTLHLSIPGSWIRRWPSSMPATAGCSPCTFGH
jgi:hypothetical protein